MNTIIWAVMTNNDQEATATATVRGVFKEGHCAMVPILTFLSVKQNKCFYYWFFVVDGPGRF